MAYRPAHGTVCSIFQASLPCNSSPLSHHVRFPTRRVASNNQPRQEPTMPPKKRPHEVIDLTDDDPVVEKSARPRLSGPSSQSSLYNGSSQRGQGQSSYASSSQPQSQHGSGSQRSGYGYSQSSFADDEPEVLDLTQVDDGPALQLYGTTDNKIVGCRYYNGIVSPGELVVLRREPSNP